MTRPGLANRAFTALSLILVFLTQVLFSGLTTAWLIIRPGPRPSPGLVRLTFAELDPTGAALLGSLITLTPGTTTIDIDLEKNELLLHLLDASQPTRTAREIHRRFELPLRRLFPSQPSPPGGDLS